MIASLLIALTAFVHLYFLVLEMVLWEGPRARRVFGLTPEFAKQTRVLAGNQGLYNGFLGVGLLYGLWLGAAGGPLVPFLLLCVVVAGIYGGLTATKAAFIAQTLPAGLALAARAFGI